MCAIAVPAFAQEPEVPVTDVSAISTPDESSDPQSSTAGANGAVQLPREMAEPEGNAFKLVARDFKNFFSADTGRTMGYVSLVAIASAPWDREGVNNGFNLPTTVFQAGNVLGSFAFQVSAGFAAYGVGKTMGDQKVAHVGRDIVRAQILSQTLVQALKYTVRRDRPDHSNDKSFPSGHAASAFATATVLHRHYGWAVGGPAYVLGGYVALARMAWNRHHASDVVMGAGFGIASARTVTMSVGKNQFNLGVQPQTGGASINFTKIYK